VRRVDDSHVMQCLQVAAFISNCSCQVVDGRCRVYDKKEEGLDANFDAQLASKGLCGSFRIWIGKDYVNFIVKDFCDLDHPFTGLFCLSVVLDHAVITARIARRMYRFWLVVFILFFY